MSSTTIRGTMNKHIGELLRILKEQNEKLHKEKKTLEQKNMFLTTQIFDHRYTIKQLKTIVDKKL